MSYKKQELLTLGSSMVVDRIHAAHLISFLCCVFCFVFFCVMCVCYVPMLPVSVDCLFLICHSVFSDVYLVLMINKQWINKIKRDTQYPSTGNHVKTTVIITLVATYCGTKIGPLLCQTNPRKQSDKISVDNPPHKPWPYIDKTFGSLVLYSNIHWIQCPDFRGFRKCWKSTWCLWILMLSPAIFINVRWITA